MTKRIFCAVFLMAVFTCGVIPFQSAVAEDVKVSEIQTVYVEKGDTNCTLSVRALVTNEGDTDDVTIKAVAVDEEGYDLQTIKFSGHIESGKTRALLEQVKMSREDCENIVSWEQKD
ncbi:MAG: hypothetical protein ACQETG_02375 [Thermodesulfobacteriota bacterium]